MTYNHNLNLSIINFNSVIASVHYCDCFNRIYIIILSLLELSFLVSASHHFHQSLYNGWFSPKCIKTWNNQTFVVNLREPPASCNLTGNMPSMLEKIESYVGKLSR